MINISKLNWNKLKATIFYITLFIFVFAMSIKYNALDVDLWARLIMGMHVAQTGLPQFQDVVSYTPTHTWYDPEWLSSAFIYIIQSKFGATGLTILKAFGVYAILVMISIAIKSRAKSNTVQYDIIYFLVLLFIMRDCTILPILRCQYITFFLVGLWICLLEKIRKGNDKLLYLLPIIMLIWLNIHGGCIAGVGILFLYGVGEFLNKKPFKKYFIALFFTCIVFLINPWGADYIKFMIESSYLDRSWISEWQSPFVKQELFTFHRTYKILMIVAFVSYVYKIWWKKITYAKLNKTKLLVLFTVAYLSAKYVKHTGIFIVASSIYLYDDYYLIFKHLFEKIRDTLQLDPIIIKHLLYFKDIIIYFTIYVSALIILITTKISTSHYATPYAANMGKYPIIPLEFLMANNLKGKIFAGFYNGSFIAYKYYPHLKIYMDGREEQVYTSEIFDDQMFFLNWVGEYPQAFMDKHPPDIFLIEQDWPANKYLMEHKDYKLIYRDYGYNIYVKNNMVKFNYIQPNVNLELYFEKIFKTNHNYKKENKKNENANNNSNIQ